MPSSEIDEIFAAKPKSTPQPFPDKTKSKPKKRKQPSAKIEQPNTTEKTSKKRSAPETVLDPSAQSAPQKRVKTAVQLNPEKKKSNLSRAEEDRFKDSRGSGPRRKTAEGYNIYKEDELGISTGGGDTPLCPFDCECCF